jgi:hypothetical protein
VVIPILPLLLLLVRLLVLMLSTLMGPVETVALRTRMVSFSSAVAARRLCTVARSGKSDRASSTNGADVVAVKRNTGRMEDTRRLVRPEYWSGVETDVLGSPCDGRQLVWR